MTSIDLKKTYADHYRAKATPTVVDGPAVTAKKKLRAGERVRVEQFAEGHAAQILHIGAYADEAPTIATLHSFIAAQGGRLTGTHHEIYLSDPRKAVPDKLRTIIRQPFANA